MARVTTLRAAALALLTVLSVGAQAAIFADNEAREEIIKLLFEHGADVQYHDPHVPLLAGMRKYMEYRMHSVPLTADSVRAADCVLIVTDHAAIDWRLIGAHARLVVDSRNAMAKVLPIAGVYLQA